ncbi:MAG TPA: hypothetical protein PK125_13605 [Syntrophorhabdus sp.]|mgnify:FL=1|jgi:hypothetical protein|nr:hypothetical protein [Syntrophorhabdus sp.]
MTGARQERGFEPFAIDAMGEALLEQLTNQGWDVRIEDDWAGDFKDYWCTSPRGPMGAFTFLDLLLFTLDNDPENVEIRFMFYADPGIVGPNKRPFGKKVRENNFRVLRDFCVSLLNGANIGSNEQETLITPSSRRKVKFGDAYVAPSYEVQLVYWREPERRLNARKST